MEILYYNSLDIHTVKKQFEKLVSFLQKGDFKSADIKKMSPGNFYRAKLDIENRVLFQFATFDGKTYILLLEVILNHEYDKSRFLRGAEINLDKVKFLESEKEIPKEDILPITFLNPATTTFHLLNKVISFDPTQEEIFNTKPPVIIIGPAGSGKTALTLEKIKSLNGSILYVTLSSYLVENSSKLYYSYSYNNEDQDIEFLSFKDYIQSIKILEGKEIDFKTFEQWFNRVRNSFPFKEAHQLFEEFKGVLTGMLTDSLYMTRQEYENLGVKQCIFLPEERSKVYDVFEKYLQYIKENSLYDLNMVSYEWQKLCQPRYDFIIIDEVQDLTNVQLFLILKSLKKQSEFILCGDSNQIVHPNFFSWSNVKSMFYKSELKGNEIKILKTNYRNAPAVTNIANRLLKIKNARFGSIDKESTYLIDSISTREGEVVFLQDSDRVKHDLNKKTQTSTKFAVLVMRNEDKAEARKIFKTPLLFSIHEAKGLEYDNIILVNFISGNDKEFREITNGIDPDDITDDLEINFSRAKDKKDKSLEAYKFYVNSLYVAITRAVENLYLIETSSKHDLLKLLNLVQAKDKLDLGEQKSSMDDWKKEARKLELQGKTEQADEIRKNILGIQTPHWKPLSVEDVAQLRKDAFSTEFFNKKAKDALMDYCLIYNDRTTIMELARVNYKRAENPELEIKTLYRKYYSHYKSNDEKLLLANINKYGVNYRDQFNLTPLMAATYTSSVKLIKVLIDNGADSELVDNAGKNALQLAINLSFFSSPYAKETIGKIYNLLLTDSIKVKVDDKLIKIDNHKIEYLLLNYLIALQPSILQYKRSPMNGVEMDDFINTMESYPESVMPSYRKKRSYINQAIARNEVLGNDAITKKLFLRIHRGNYLLNPDLEILHKGTWINIYDVMQQKRPANQRFY